MKLATTDTQLHELQTIEDGARASSSHVKVPREALKNLLLDHFTLNSAVLRKTGALPETTD